MKTFQPVSPAYTQWWDTYRHSLVACQGYTSLDGKMQAAYMIACKSHGGVVEDYHGPRVKPDAMGL